jgi:NADPH:quinone reductase-like Zn-dependent oxidoreductase
MAKAATAAAAATTTAMTMLKVGDIVTGCPVKFKHGSLCEYTLSPALGLSHVQPDWTFVENAGLNVTCCTFMTALQDAGVDISKLQRPAQAQQGQKHVMNQSTTSSPPFKSILILGSSGGCGSVAVQICKGMGIERIVGVCSAKNADFCSQLGATEVVCYDDDTDKLTDFCRQNVGAFDVVYDTVSDGSSDDYLSDPKIMALAKDTNPIDSLKPNYLTLNASPYG